MPKLNWQIWRIPLLAASLGGVLVVLGKSATLPKVDKTAAAQPVNLLPATVPLDDWRSLEADPLKPNGESRSSQRYRYQKGSTTLDIDVQYMTSDGNISRYLFVYTPIRADNVNLQPKYQPGVGHYGMLTHQDRIYLTACINPRGESTVTEQQFTQNRYANDLKVSRILPWILGKESLIDRRCMWTLMSLPLKPGASKPVPLKSETATASSQLAPLRSPEPPDQTLETTWFSWHRWWQQNYPAR